MTKVLKFSPASSSHQYAKLKIWSESSYCDLYCRRYFSKCQSGQSRLIDFPTVLWRDATLRWASMHNTHHNSSWFNFNYRSGLNRRIIWSTELPFTALQAKTTNEINGVTGFRCHLGDNFDWAVNSTTQIPYSADVHCWRIYSRCASLQLAVSWNGTEQVDLKYHWENHFPPMAITNQV